MFACLSPAYEGLESLTERVLRTGWLTYVVVLPVALLFGVPVYRALQPRVSPSPLNFALAGAAVSAAPWLVLTLLARPDEAWMGGRVTVHHGFYTLAGWIEVIRFLALIAGLGAASALVFWCVVVPFGGVKMTRLKD